MKEEKDYTVVVVEAKTRDWIDFHAIQRESLFGMSEEDEYDPHFYDQYRPDEEQGVRRLQVLLKYRGEAIGITTLEFQKDGGSVARGVAIKREYQRQGHGMVLTEHVSRIAEISGARELRVNAGALSSRFYIACGFVPFVWSQTELDRWNASGTTNPLPIQMVRRLG